MKSLSLFVILCVLIPAVHAQESTATGPLENQMSWSALHNLIEQANGNAKNALTLATAIKDCGVQKKIYGPGAEGADANGCVSIQTHMHWNAVKSAMWTVYKGGNQAMIQSITAFPLCSNVGEKPVQMNFCQTLNKTCYTRTESKMNCTNRGSGTGCNGNPTPGNVTLWTCM